MNVPLAVRPLRHRSFRFATLALFASLAGNYLYLTALPFGFIALGGSAFDVGAGTGIATSTQILLLLVGGAVVDRSTSRTVLVVADTARAIALATAALLGVTGYLAIWHLYVVAAIFGACAAFSAPAVSAIMPTLVPSEILVQGNVLRALSRQASRAFGSLLAGFLVVAAAPAAAFGASAALLLCGPLFLLRLPRVAADGPMRTPLARDIAEGARFIARVPWLWSTIVGFAIVNTAIFAPLAIALPFLVRDVLLADAQLYGVILAAGSVGQLAGALVLANARPRRAGIVMWLAAAASGVAIAGFGLTPIAGAVLALAALDGIGFVTFAVVKDSVLQRHVPPRLLGRVASVDALGVVALGPTSPIVGALTNEYGPRAVFLGGGIAALFVSSVLLALPWIRALELDREGSNPRRVSGERRA